MFDKLRSTFAGELYDGNSTRDQAMKLVYATDASVYQEKPVAVAIPKTVDDLKSLIALARESRLRIIVGSVHAPSSVTAILQGKVPSTVVAP